MASIGQIIKQGLKSFSFGGSNGQAQYYNPYGGYYNPLPGAQHDYRAEAGIPWENSAVMACVNWAIRSFPEAQLKLRKRNSDGEWIDVAEHPALELLCRPNKDYSSNILWSGALISLMLDGNGYWYVEKNGFDIPTSLYFMPYFQVNPRWKDNGTDYITDYIYRTGDKQFSLPVDRIIHFRNGVSLSNTRKGNSPLAPVLREMCTDNEASTAAAAIMRNLGMPGLSFTPASSDQEITQEQRQKMREMARDKFTGDRRGEMLVLPIPGSIESFGFSPEQLAFDKVRRLPEERITACYGIPAVVVGLGAGLERSTFANFKEAREAAYESFMSPLWNALADQLTEALLPQFGQDANEMRFYFDTSTVKALQENQSEMHQRVRADWEAGILDLEEARTILGYQKTQDSFGKGQFITHSPLSSSLNTD